MEDMGESGRHQGLEPDLLTLNLQNHPESICSHGTSRKIVQTEGRQRWHQEPRSATGSQAPGFFCLSFPLGMKKRLAAMQVCLLAPNVVFSPPWVHLCRAAGAASVGKAGALQRP